MLIQGLRAMTDSWQYFVDMYKRKHTVHSNEHSETYRMIPTTILIDKYWGRHFKLMAFLRISQIFDHFWEHNLQISPKVQQYLKNHVWG